MSIFHRLIPSVLLPSGLAGELINLLAFRKRDRVAKHGKPLPHNKTRVHFFAGHFGTKDAAKKYCFQSADNVPEELTRELPDAFIDTTFVEVVFRGHQERLAEFLDPSEQDKFLSKIGGKSTLILIAEPAFGGFPYALHDTSVLNYLGSTVVDI